MSEEQITYKISLNRVLRKGFREAYDHLGYVVFTTFAVFIITSAVLSVSALAARAEGLVLPLMVLVTVTPGAFVAWLGAVGVFYYSYKSIYHEHPVFADTWRGVGVLLKPAVWVFVVDLLVTVVLAGDAFFFLVLLGGQGGVFPVILGVVFAYLTLMWLMMCMYHLPLLAAQLSMESGPRVGVIIKKSYLLTADNPGFTVGLFVVIIAFAVLCALPMLIGIATIFLGATAFLLTFALRELFVKYGIVEEEPEVIEDKPWTVE